MSAIPGESPEAPPQEAGGKPSQNLVRVFNTSVHLTSVYIDKMCAFCAGSYYKSN